MIVLSQRQYQVVVFGATGFTGKHTIEEIVKTLKTGNVQPFTWAVAGRSIEKINLVMDEISKLTGVDLSSVDRIIADVNNPQSLEEMATRCNIVLNTVGPFAKFGEAVILACIRAKTHHLDVNAESHNLTEMQVKHSKIAEAAGVFIIGGCGFDSIPNECGINYLRDRFDGDLHSVESYLYIGNNLWTNKINFGTWTSILHFFAEFPKLRPLLRTLYPEELPTPKYKLKTRYLIHRDSRGETGSCIPLPHPDLWAVERSQNYYYQKTQQRPIQYMTYLKQSNILLTLLVGIGGLFLGLLVKFRLGVCLLDRYPRLFSAGFISRQGPTRTQMESFKFSFTLVGKGWAQKLEAGCPEHSQPPSKTQILKIDGVNPAYGATCTSLVQSAITILCEPDSMPQSGGVYTPGTAFVNTQIVQRLHEHGLTFNFI